MSIKNWVLLLVLAFVKLQILFLLSPSYGFHEDELLYLSLGKNLQLGYLETSPMIAFLASLAQSISSNSTIGIRIMSALPGVFLIVLVGRMAYEMGGKTFAILFSAFIVLLSPTYLRIHVLFQPIGWDVLGWAVLSYVWIRYLKTEKKRYLVSIGIVTGIFFLNKHSILIGSAAILLANTLSKGKKWIFDKNLWLGILIGLIISTPHLIWLIWSDSSLNREIESIKGISIAYDASIDFIIDQFIVHLPVTWVWVLGLTGFWKSKTLRPFKSISLYFVILMIFLFMLGDSNRYALGAFPVMLAAGAVAVERLTLERKFLRIPAIIIPIVLIIPLLPFSIPIIKPEKLALYSASITNKTRQNPFNRWEDGSVGAIPQDFAKMLGWESLTKIVAQSYYQVSEEERENTVIFCETSFQAAAINYYGDEYNLPKSDSFSGSFAWWLEKPEQANRLIYVGQNLDKVIKKKNLNNLLVGTLTEEFSSAKETKVWLLSEAQSDIDNLYEIYK